MKRHDEKPEIAYEILAYLSENPDAQDTLEGIIEWWLLERRIRSETRNVKEALARLIADGQLVERTGKDQRIHYRVNRRRLAGIKRLLKQRPSNRGPAVRGE